MADGAGVPWDTCVEADCTGAPLGADGRCLAHATTVELEAALASNGAAVDVDGRGVHFTGEALTRFLDLVPQDEAGRRLFGNVALDGATFVVDAPFDQAHFAGVVSMTRTVFKKAARFGDARFAGPVDLSEARFESQAWFVGASFGGQATFRATRFGGPAWFQQSAFSSHALFEGASFSADASMSGMRCAGVASFWGVRFDGHARFEGSSSWGGWRFEGATFQIPGEGPREPAPPPGPEPDLVPVPAGAAAGAALGGRAAGRRPSRSLPSWVPEGSSLWGPLVGLVVVALFAFTILRPERRPAREEDSPNAGLSGYGFLHRDPDRRTPTRYNPCEPIRFVVNPALGPPGWTSALDGALAEVTRASGLRFQAEGTTDEVIKPDLPSDPDRMYGWPKGVGGYAKAYRNLFNRQSYQPDRYGKERWAPVLVAWTRFSEHGADEDEYPGASASEPRQGKEVATYVSGTVLLNADARILDLRSLLMHELGHLVGLAHVGEPNQLMYRNVGQVSGQPTEWGPGDREGLRRVGQQFGCLPAPTPKR